MKVFKLYFDKDKETDWLNEMAAKGWAMTGFIAGLYTFDRCDPGRYVYQIDFGNRLFFVEDGYRSFMAENGIEIVQSWGFWVILRKLADSRPFELYTDIDSRIEHYKKIKNMFKVVAIIEMICMLMELFAAINTGNAVFYGFFFLLFAMVVIFVRMSVQTGDTIAFLQEQKTGIEEFGRHRPSFVLAIAMLLISICLIFRETFSDSLAIVLMLTAIAIMLVGIYQTVRNYLKK